MLADLIGKGVEVKTCGTRLKARGIRDEDLVDGIQRGTMMILANWIKECDKVISF